jgi:hypothetical protein
MEEREIQQDLPEDKKKTRSFILDQLRETQPTEKLQNYFETLERGCSTWDEETFIQGVYLFSEIVGYRRREYFSELWSGCKYPNAFEELWRENHPELPITVWDQDFGRQCPTTWSNKILNSRHVLTYHGEGPLSQGLNELVRGPTGVDCGMISQLCFWMGCRYVFGDEIFNQVFDNGENFRITQTWNEKVNEDGTEGSHLYQFYDVTDTNHQTRIKTRTFNNHRLYQLKHPGGSSKLENAIEIDAQYLLFDPNAARKSLSFVEVEQKLLTSYNATQNFADRKTLSLWDLIPDYVHVDFSPHTFGQMREHALCVSKHTLSIEDLRSDRAEQEDLCEPFNFRRLKSYVEAALEKQA